MAIWSNASASWRRAAAAAVSGLSTAASPRSYEMWASLWAAVPPFDKTACRNMMSKRSEASG